MIPFFDSFSGNLKSASQGAPDTELPSDGTGQTDIGRILEGLSDSVEGGRSFVNSFKDTGTGPGTKKNAPVETRQGTSGVLFGLNLNEPLGKLVLVAVLAAAFFAFRRFSK